MTNFVPLPAAEHSRRLNDLGLRALNIGNTLKRAPDALAHRDMLMDYLKGDEEELARLFPRGSKDFDEQWRGSGMMVLMSYCGISQDKLDPLLIDETITELFTGQGMFAPYVSETPVRVNPPVPKLLAPLYRLVLNDPETFETWRYPVMHAVSRLVLQNGPGLESFLDSLKKLEQTRGGPTYVDLLHDIASEVLNGIAYKIPDEFVQAGGLEALIRSGVDLVALHDEYQEALRLNSHAPKSFPAMYQLTKDIIGHLADKEIVNEDLRDYYLQVLATNTLAELRRRDPEGKVDGKFWSGVLTEIGGDLVIEKLTLGDIVILGKYANATDKLFEAELPNNFVPDAFKKKITDSFTEEDRYEMVLKLRAEHLYTEPEMLRIRGSKFQAELGV
jgi:hypothetical protein